MGRNCNVFPLGGEMKGIYQFKCVFNEKSYIGKSTNLQKRYREHQLNHVNKRVGNYNSYFYRALRKHGFENFEYTILLQGDDLSDEELNAWEVKFIKKYQTYGSGGYNSTRGGEDNPSNNPEVVRRRTERLLNEPEINEKLRHRGEKNPRATVKDFDVFEIRRRYSKGEHKNSVYEDYRERLNSHSFDSIWWGQTWKHISMEVYTQRPMRNRGGSKLTEYEVLDIRLRKKAGEERELVYLEYSSKVGRVGFGRIWNNITWKDITV